MLLLSLAACTRPPAPPLAPVVGAGVAAAAGAPACGAWAGVAGLGTTWTSTVSEAYARAHHVSGGGTTRVTRLEGPDVELTHDARFEGAGGWFEVHRVERWRCDADGAWWIASEARTHGVSGSATVGVHIVRTFDPGWLVRPADAEVGHSWEDRFTVTTVREGFPTTTEPARCRTVVGPDTELVLPAGRRVARQLDSDCDGVGIDAPWVVAGEGWVADPDLELVAYAR